MTASSDRLPIKYYIEFDKITKYGSPEHFFHFMWGYMLPALNEITNIESNTAAERTSNKFYIRSCGPVMDKLTDELLSLYNCNYEIIEKNDLDAENHLIKIIVPRWDIWLSHFQLSSGDLKKILTSKSPKNLVMWLKNLILLKNNKFKADFLASMLNVKKNTLKKIASSIPASAVDLYADSYLILKRSPQPEYYEKGGKAEVAAYGTARRALVGIEDAIQHLRNNSIPVIIFEPGKHTLTEQIKVFQNCRGIVGIKGAEFANLIWMKPKSRVILIRPLNMRTPPVQKSLAEFLGLDYSEITTNEGSYPRLNADLILNCLINE